MFGVEWWLRKVGCCSCHVGGLQFLLATRGTLIGFGIFSIEAFECPSQVNPSYFEGVPLSNQEFVFDVPFDAARNVAESQVKRLSKSEGVEYS